LRDRASGVPFFASNFHLIAGGAQGRHEGKAYDHSIPGSTAAKRNAFKRCMLAQALTQQFNALVASQGGSRFLFMTDTNMDRENVLETCRVLQIPGLDREVVVLGPGPRDYILSDMEGEVEQDHDIMAWDRAHSAVIVRLRLFAVLQQRARTRAVLTPASSSADDERAAAQKSAEIMARMQATARAAEEAMKEDTIRVERLDVRFPHRHPQAERFPQTPML